MAETTFNWTVPADHPAFAGHFPGNPIVPGVVLLDRAVLFAEALQASPHRCWQVGNAKFLSPAGPGDALVFTLEVRPSGAIAFTVRAGTRDVASGSLTPTSSAD
jgi:3-hydroxyacyl-[acyl-carrier-protein] dehydratase